MRHSVLIPIVIGAAAIGATMAVPDGWAQRDIAVMAPDEAQAELERATRESQRAQARADRFTSAADAAIKAADKTAREAAAIAAQIQASEANIAAARARYSLTQADRRALSASLAERREPLAQLTAALQTTARRPLALSALQPGSLKDLVYVRAVLDSAVPQIRDRTAALRGDLERGRELEEQAARELAKLGASEEELQTRRAQLAALESQQRLASREARSNALREGERALALAEDARDLDGLIDLIDEAADLRRDLAALPGPVMRPANVAAGSVSAQETPIGDIDSPPTPSASASSAALQSFQLPVQGRTVAGFGELRESGLRSNALSLAPSPGAQVVAPASGRIAFAGLYRGYGRIVIIEHPGGWTSLVTGLERVAVEVGDEVIMGSPLGVAGRDEPMIGIELRRNGDPVNPLNHLR